MSLQCQNDDNCTVFRKACMHNCMQTQPALIGVHAAYCTLLNPAHHLYKNDVCIFQLALIEQYHALLILLVQCCLFLRI